MLSQFKGKGYAGESQFIAIHEQVFIVQGVTIHEGGSSSMFFADVEVAVALGILFVPDSDVQAGHFLVLAIKADGADPGAPDIDGTLALQFLEGNAEAQRLAVPVNAGKEQAVWFIQKCAGCGCHVEKRRTGKSGNLHPRLHPHPESKGEVPGSRREHMCCQLTVHIAGMGV